MCVCTTQNLVNTPWSVYTDKEQIWWAYIWGNGGLIFERKNTSICNLLNLLFFLFFQCKARILAFFTSCKMWKKLRKVNDKVKNKDTADIVLTSLLLHLNTFHLLLQCFYCCLWWINYQLGLSVVLTLCAWWNQFRQSFHLWRN